MIVGIGTDIIELERIKKSLENERFLMKYFTSQEIELYESRQKNPEVIAGNFAIKEAVSKVFGTGIVFNLTDIEVLRDEKGKPYVSLYHKALEISTDLDIKTIHVSISHNKSHVIGFAIGES